MSSQDTKETKEYFPALLMMPFPPQCRHIWFIFMGLVLLDSGELCTDVSILQEHMAEIRNLEDKQSRVLDLSFSLIFYDWLVGFGVLLIVFLIYLEFPFLPINSLSFKKEMC